MVEPDGPVAKPRVPHPTRTICSIREQRRRMQIAGAVASLLGALAGSLILMYAGRLAFRWEQWVNENLAHVAAVQSTTGAVTTISRATPLWASLIINIPPLAILMLSCVGVALVAYEMLRGRRHPKTSDRTRCGWCEHELRGISVPACSECGHRIGERGPDNRGELPVGRQWAYRLRGFLVLTSGSSSSRGPAIAVFGVLIVGLVIPGPSINGPVLFFVPFLIASANHAPKL